MQFLPNWAAAIPHSCAPLLMQEGFERLKVCNAPSASHLLNFYSFDEACRHFLHA
jgi:predicted RNA-binding Zn ribbon-like protein